jgi:predicted nucleic acid-binding protein
LAYLKMRETGIEEIYTFDNHFRNLDVKVVQE